MSKIWEIEDYLSECEVFVSGISGEPTHSDSYMTVLDYKKLIEVYKSSTYTDDEWLSVAHDWIDSPNRIPPLYLAGCEIRRQIGKKQII